MRRTGASVAPRGHGLRDRQPEGRRGKTTTAVTSPPASRRPATRRCWSTSIRRPTRPSGSAFAAPRLPGLYEVLTGEARREEALTETPLRASRLLPAGAGPGRRQCRAATDGGLRVPPARAPSRRSGAASGTLLLDCPPSLGPLTVTALVAADRVIVPVQTEYFALEGLAGLLETLELIQRELQPRLTVAGMLLTMHDSRTRLGAGRRARGPRRTSRARLRDRDPAQRARRRGPQLRSAGDPPRSPQRWRGSLFRAGQGGGGAWLGRSRGWGGG